MNLLVQTSAAANKKRVLTAGNTALNTNRFFQSFPTKTNNKKLVIFRCKNQYA
jgi:hypothetical protein